MQCLYVDQSLYFLANKVKEHLFYKDRYTTRLETDTCKMYMHIFY